MLSHSADSPPFDIISEWDLAVRTVKVELLDENRKFLNLVATAFYFIDENNKCYLFLPWHVVTGYKYPDLEVKDPPNRRFIRTFSKDIVTVKPGHHSLGGMRSDILPLYDEDGLPLWIQEQQYYTHPDLKLRHIRVPAYTDLVALPVNIEPHKARFLCYTPGQVANSHVQNGQEVVITGYPYGYSALGDLTPEPLFVTRHIASWVMAERPHDFLIDGVGAQGMSGSPIFIRAERGLKLLGIYTRAVFPDAASTGRKQDIYSTLGVGIRFSSRLHFNNGEDYILMPEVS